ncbi:hypothetical protein DVA67_000445 [Solirubrobacter sp. CPCC 204708]|uniref:FtsX-like permease family protein n=1 Tax=Solirubrobacter deserti TaxID=2282478 RepID=A0ABT4RLY1_9ACTN|nr:hypothetical protein [Solirubrobacter deserti]MBE2314426.1 hypothetical protein [Solirubrobacter deserti]MDA0139572.1 hypothetical protein [Solirubrobacter deserti]
MKVTTTIRLARSAADAERRRTAIIAGSIALAGQLLLFALHVARGSSADGLVSYVTEDDLQLGVIVGALLLIVPVLALTVQALRTASVARDQRLAALRLAGATPGQLRAIAAAQAGWAAALGAVLAAPAYLVFWIAAGVLPPSGARLVAVPDAADVVTWLALIPVLTVCGTGAGALLRERGGGTSARPGAANAAALIAGALLVVVSMASYVDSESNVGLLIAIVGLLVFAFAAGPRLVLAAARALERRPDTESLLAARRLRADPRTAGRVAAVLMVCGVALGFQALYAYETLNFEYEWAAQDLGFYVGGLGLSVAVVVAGAAVAVFSLVLNAIEHLVAARRPLATLAVFGLDERGLGRVLVRQLLATVVPAVALGAALGNVVLFSLISVAIGAWPPADELLGPALLGLAAAVVAALLLALVARLAVRLLRPLVRAAIAPENLRAA